MRRFSTHSALRASALLLAAGVAAGCVTRGTHGEVVAERDRLALDRQRLEKRVDLLETSNESLDSERVRLIDEMEDLRQRREELDGAVTRLRRTEEQLASELREREDVLARRNVEIERLRGTYEGLVSDLESEVAAGQIRIEQLREGLRLDVAQDILFASGSARLNPNGQSLLRKVAGRLRELPHFVEVQGHTDNVPIRAAMTQRYPSNWELAAARATEVVRLLEGAGVGSSRLTATSFGEHRPVAANDTPKGRARNRRIEVRLKPPPPEATAPSAPLEPPVPAAAP